MNAPDDYPHRELLVSPNSDAGTTVILLDRGAEVDALTLDLFRDALAIRASVLFAAQDRASLALAVAAFCRLADQGAPTIH